MEEGSVDRISGMPEGILHHILSFLLTKDAIQTSATCKRLNQVWTTHPYLDLGENFFPILPPKEEGYDIQNIEEEVGHHGDQNIEEEVGHEGDQNIEEEEVGHQGDQNIEEEEIVHRGNGNINIEEGCVEEEEVDEEDDTRSIEKNIVVDVDGDQNIKEAEEQPSNDEDGVGRIEEEEDYGDDDDDADDDDSSIEDEEHDTEIILRKREKLFTFVQQMLTRMRMHDITIQKFRIGGTKLDVELRQYLDRWIHSLIHSNINELVLQISDRAFYDLPPKLLAASSLRRLNLARCRMPSGSIPLWSSLQKLELLYVHLDEKILQEIISSCPDLENLLLYYCLGLKKRVLLPARSKLRFLHVNMHNIEEAEEFVLEAHNLERFAYSGGCSPTRINIITNFEARLKYLHFCGANITSTWLCDLISRLSHLEDLRLTQLSLKAIEISSSSLKRLSLRNVFYYHKENRIGEFAIDAPNLVQLTYLGWLSCVFRNSLAAKKVLIITDLTYSEWTDELVCNKLMQFLHNFDSSEEVTLDCTSFEHMIFPVVTRLNLLAPLPRIKSLILQGKFCRSLIDVLPDILKGLLWMAPNLVNLSLKDKKSNEVCPVDLTKFTSEVSAAGCDRSSLRKFELNGCADAGATEVARISRHILNHIAPFL